MNGKTALIASIVVVVAAMGVLIFSGLSDNMVYYYHVDEFLSKASSLGGETVKVNGKVQLGSIRKQQTQYDFVIHGEEQNTVRVTYNGIVPDTFKDGSDVVVEGRYDPDSRTFHASTLLAKCPTKYEPEQQAKAQETATP